MFGFEAYHKNSLLYPVLGAVFYDGSRGTVRRDAVKSHGLAWIFVKNGLEGEPIMEANPNNFFDNSNNTRAKTKLRAQSQALIDMHLRKDRVMRPLLRGIAQQMLPGTLQGLAQNENARRWLLGLRAMLNQESVTSVALQIWVELMPANVGSAADIRFMVTQFAGDFISEYQSLNRRRMNTNSNRESTPPLAENPLPNHMLADGTNLLLAPRKKPLPTLRDAGLNLEDKQVIGGFIGATAEAVGKAFASADYFHETAEGVAEFIRMACFAVPELRVSLQTEDPALPEGFSWPASGTLTLATSQTSEPTVPPARRETPLWGDNNPAPATSASNPAQAPAASTNNSAQAPAANNQHNLWSSTAANSNAFVNQANIGRTWVNPSFNFSTRPSK